MRAAEAAYEDIRNDAHTAQIARSVLPTCLKTEIIMTANFREWRHFIRLRTAPAAHPQMRMVAGAVLLYFARHFAVIVEDLVADS